MNTKNVKAEIHRLRFEDGLNLQEIAKRFEKSIYWVNARLNKDYEPRRSRQSADNIGGFEKLNIAWFKSI
jgi:hypothetical protein